MAACVGRPLSAFARAALAEDSGERFNLDQVLKDIYDV